jgi:hypothetical protein
LCYVSVCHHPEMTVLMHIQNPSHYKLEDFLGDVDPLPGSLTNCKIIFINGPPRAGKDSLGSYLERTCGTKTVKMAETLKQSVYADFGLPLDLDIEFFDSVKGEPLPIFDGLSFRQACIEKSENRTKPWRGKEWFGKMLVRKIKREGYFRCAITDSGFAEEAEPVMRAVGRENCLLLRVHAEERGISFEGDSRSYIELEGVQTYDLENNTTNDPYLFFQQALSIVIPFLDM